MPTKTELISVLKMSIHRTHLERISEAGEPSAGTRAHEGPDGAPSTRRAFRPAGLGRRSRHHRLEVLVERGLVLELPRPPRMGSDLPPHAVDPEHVLQESLVKHPVLDEGTAVSPNERTVATLGSSSGAVSGSKSSAKIARSEDSSPISFPQRSNWTSNIASSWVAATVTQPPINRTDMQDSTCARSAAAEQPPWRRHADGHGVTEP